MAAALRIDEQPGPFKDSYKLYILDPVDLKKFHKYLRQNWFKENNIWRKSHKQTKQKQLASDKDLPSQNQSI